MLLTHAAVGRWSRAAPGSSVDGLRAGLPRAARPHSSAAPAPSSQSHPTPMSSLCSPWRCRASVVRSGRAAMGPPSLAALAHVRTCVALARLLLWAFRCRRMPELPGLAVATGLPLPLSVQRRYLCPTRLLLLRASCHGLGQWGHVGEVWFPGF